MSDNGAGKNKDQNQKGKTVWEDIKHKLAQSKEQIRSINSAMGHTEVSNEAKDVLTNVSAEIDSVLDEIIESSEGLPEKQWLHKELTDQIDREFELIGNRVSWLLTTTAFLFTAMAVSAANIDACKAGFAVLRELLRHIPHLGLSLSVISLIGCLAADWVILRRKRVRSEVEDKLLDLLPGLSDVQREFETRFLPKFLLSKIPITVPRNSPRNWIGFLTTYAQIVLIIWAWCFAGAESTEMIEELGATTACVKTNGERDSGTYGDELIDRVEGEAVETKMNENGASRNETGLKNAAKKHSNCVVQLPSSINQ